MTSAQQANVEHLFQKRVAVVGHTGRMGHMLLEAAKKANIHCEGVDLPLAPADITRALGNANIVILCVPASSLTEVIGKISPFMRKDATLADITSVKEIPMRQMRSAWQGDIVGTHPLFGPCNQPGDDLPVAIVADPESSSHCFSDVKTFFECIGCRVFECSAEKHDEAMARIQNMNFITNLAYFSLLADQKDLLPFITPSFIRRKNAAAKMLTEDAEMFSTLFEFNPHSHEAVRQFRKMLNVAASGDLDLLTKKAQWWWPEHSGKKSSQEYPSGASLEK